MADKLWEEVEAGFNAARWTLALLRDQLESLEAGGKSEWGEFGMAATETDKLLRKLVDTISVTYLRREKGSMACDGPVETFHKYIQIVPERYTWEEMLSNVVGEVPAGRVLIRELEPVPTRALQEFEQDAYAFLHFNPHMDLTKDHWLLREERPARIFPAPEGQKVVLSVNWYGYRDAGNKPGEIAVFSPEVVAVRRFKFLFDMIQCMERLPGVVTPTALMKLGFEVQQSKGASNAPEASKSPKGTSTHPSS